MKGCQGAIVLSNDTDVLALLLYYTNEFMSNDYLSYRLILELGIHLVLSYCIF